MQSGVALLPMQGQFFCWLQLAVANGFLPRKTKILLANSLDRTMQSHPMANRIKKHDPLQDVLTKEQLRQASRMAKHLDFSCLRDKTAGLSLKESMDKKMEENQRLWKQALPK